MVAWVDVLSSGVRWAFGALLVVFILLFFEGSGMLSKLTEGHKKVRIAMSIAFWVVLAFTVFFVVICLANPSVDTTTSDITEIKQVLNGMSDTLRSIQVTLENIQDALE